MDTYTIILIAMGATILALGMKFVTRIRAMKSIPEEEQSIEKKKVQQLLQKHLEEQKRDTEAPDDEIKQSQES